MPGRAPTQRGCTMVQKTSTSPYFEQRLRFHSKKRQVHKVTPREHLYSKQKKWPPRSGVLTLLPRCRSCGFQHSRQEPRETGCANKWCADIRKLKQWDESNRSHGAFARCIYRIRFLGLREFSEATSRPASPVVSFPCSGILGHVDSEWDSGRTGVSH